MVGKSIYLSLYDFVPFQIGYHQSRDKIIPTHILDHVWKKKYGGRGFFLMIFFCQVVTSKLNVYILPSHFTFYKSAL